MSPLSCHPACSRMLHESHPPLPASLLASPKTQRSRRGSALAHDVQSFLHPQQIDVSTSLGDDRGGGGRASRRESQLGREVWRFVGECVENLNLTRAPARR